MVGYVDNGFYVLSGFARAEMDWGICPLRRCSQVVRFPWSVSPFMSLVFIVLTDIHCSQRQCTPFIARQRCEPYSINTRNVQRIPHIFAKLRYPVKSKMSFSRVRRIHFVFTTEPYFLVSLHIFCNCIGCGQGCLWRILRKQLTNQTQYCL